MSTVDQQAFFRCFARVADGLSHAHRLALLQILGQAERDLESLTALTGLPLASVSQHLQRLKRAGLVEVRREGRRRVYRLSSPRVSALSDALGRLAIECLDEAAALEAARRGDAERAVSADELLRLLHRNETVIVDVRPREEYAFAHVEGALNVPLDELEGRLGELPRGRDLVVYCRGPFCVTTDEAVALLRGRGFGVRTLDRSVADLALAGVPVTRA